MITINKFDLANELAKKTGKNQFEILSLFDLYWDTITEHLTLKRNVKIMGFGFFETQKTKARTGSHPITKQPIAINPVTVVKFRAAENLKNKIKDI